MYENELYHYGVLGMKWGVRRSSAQLGNKVSKLQSKNTKLSSKVKSLDDAARTYDSKSTKMISKNSKYEAQITKATAKKAKYDLKLQKELGKRHTSEDKVAKYTVKSNKYDKQIMKANKKLKYNKWAVKAAETKEAANKARREIEKNEKLMSTFNSTIKAIDNGTIRQGRIFMRYEED